MGETGIGKTSLITLLSEYMGFDITVFNCHAGITE